MRQFDPGVDPDHGACVRRSFRVVAVTVGELFDCVLDPDEYVGVRAATPSKKVCRQDPAIVAPICGRVLAELAASDQPSVQWHIAQILGQVRIDGPQRRRAVQGVRRYLETSGDWIVLSHSMGTLAGCAEPRPEAAPGDRPLRSSPARRRSMSRRGRST